MLFTLLPDLNVAALKYANILSEKGGPIRAVSYRERELPEGRLFEAYATLDPARTGSQGGPHGVGLAPTKPEAIHEAVSRALAFWAWQAGGHSNEPFPFGLSAFPGLGIQGARKRAFFSAAKAWCLRAWWEGALPHAALAGKNGIQITSPVPGVSIALLTREEAGALVAGAGASFSAASALAKAEISLQRSLDFHAGAAPAPTHPIVLRDPAAFQARLQSQGKRLLQPALELDEAISGPWQDYAHVWRCSFDRSIFRERDKAEPFAF